ncbi:pyridoxal phosphate-dependent aminotransferase [Desulfococcus multivorans]|uniref:Aminotransferase n=1 Tax=Desulfococcus multivorans DSM 2059 TaxID=1121405 RepID=S7TB28_DESML|nr:pyridoxal phosphate-dependent aminotransferase [Desulfococcus multivorans]AOY58756.1 AspC1: aspartate aminotransferase [Desulfococcus multivorans]AQV01040.1 aminotransferase class I and II [Desulfococcus multivorans]EPR34332.1 aminotransferase class I and II [Desulfococcus multivorans DSM 2059]SJZ49524.1 aspartate aminotransferase [Desulfococcus multivorans DSM 2059]
MRLSRRIEAVEASRTVRFTALIERLRSGGRDIVNFAVGEPEFPTPDAIVAATQAALARGETRYGPVAGMARLRSAVAESFAGWGPENILIANGSKQILYGLFQVLLDPGDEVILPNPHWVSFSQQIRLAGACPVMVDTHRHQLDRRAIAAAVTPRTRAILVNSPNNPTGAVYPPQDLAWIADLARERDLWIIADEAYAFFVYDNLDHHSLFAYEAIRDRLIVVRSFSKSFSMTGFRVGYGAGPEPLIRALGKLQSHLTGNVCTFAQHGALAAMDLDPTVVQKWRGELAEKRDIAHEYAARLFTCVRPQGAFYLFPDISARLQKGETAEDFAAALLEKTGVAVVPGEAFGAQNHIRISYAVPKETLVEGFERMEKALLEAEG